MRTVAALVLSGLLTVLAYMIFWWVILDITTKQMRGAVEQVMGAELSYANPLWAPDLRQVVMRLPAVKLAFKDGPVAELSAPAALLETGFILRDRWRLQLPAVIQVKLRNGTAMRLRSQNGELVWLQDLGQLSLRAKVFELLDSEGNSVSLLEDVVMERKVAEQGVRVNVASRPAWAGKQGLLTAQLTMPPVVWQAMLGSVGVRAEEPMPTWRELMLAVMQGLQQGGELEIGNISFKTQLVNGALHGKLAVTKTGLLYGELLVAGERVDQLQDWLEWAKVAKPRDFTENLGWQQAQLALRRQNLAQPLLRLETLADSLLVQGYAVGGLPVAKDVVSRLWPE